MTRIEKRFELLRKESRKAFVPYITAGDPNLETTHDLVLAMEKAGADIIELGVPFSDPIADGPVIQRGTERALANRVALRDVIRLGEDIRKQSQIPLLLFSYYNPLWSYGLERLAADCAKAGFDGVLATDLTLEESDEFQRILQKAGLNTVFLVAPTSSAERMQKIAKASTGFLYAVSRTGVTGERQTLDSDLQEFLQTLRSYTSVPIAVGFGISNPDQVQAIWRQADGAIVGSAIVREIETHLGQRDLVERVAAFTRWLCGGPPSSGGSL
jgi:tryptophan synthase alpha chain